LPSPEFVERISQYMFKAIHEAKVNSSWVNPNPAYDEAVNRFVHRILDEHLSGRFLDDFRAFHAMISHLGMLNSLAQTLLKLTAPGVPDFYQGTELWDFSLVDPDNRRPVDYEQRERLLRELKAQFVEHQAHSLSHGNHQPRPERRGGSPAAAVARELLQTKEDGRVKLYVTWRGLQCRREHAGLFTRGDYEPVAAQGSRADNVFAFLRRAADRTAIAVVPRLLTRLITNAVSLPLGVDVWGDSMLLLPGVHVGQPLLNVFTGTIHEPVAWDGQAAVPLADIFADFPVALLMGR
jgi:(1->4)-alpha-D-glucan 1-alpha-D-glucosylmutase